jgi:hypothetical protein
MTKPVYLSLTFGFVFAFLTAFVMLNAGKNAGLGASPGIFVSVFSALIAGAGIGTGTYFIFRNINTTVTGSETGPASSGGLDWYDQINSDYIQNQTANTAQQTAQVLQQIQNMQANQASAPPATTPATPGAPATTPATPGAPATPAAPTWTTPSAQNCSMQGLSTDQQLMCLFANYTSSGQVLSAYQLQQLASESGIPLSTIQSTYSTVTQNQMASDWSAAQSVVGNKVLPIPPLAAGATPPAAPPPPATTPGTPATSSKKKLSPGIKAAIAVPVVIVGILGLVLLIKKFASESALDFVKTAAATARAGVTAKPTHTLLGFFAISSLIITVVLGGLKFKDRKNPPSDQKKRDIALYVFLTMSVISSVVFAILKARDAKAAATPANAAPANPADPAPPPANPVAPLANSKKAGIERIMQIASFIVTIVLGGLKFKNRKNPPSDQNKRDIAMYFFMAIAIVSSVFFAIAPANPAAPPANPANPAAPPANPAAPAAPPANPAAPAPPPANSAASLANSKKAGIEKTMKIASILEALGRAFGIKGKSRS